MTTERGGEKERRTRRGAAEGRGVKKKWGRQKEARVIGRRGRTSEGEHLPRTEYTSPAAVHRLAAAADVPARGPKKIARKKERAGRRTTRIMNAYACRGGTSFTARGRYAIRRKIGLGEGGRAARRDPRRARAHSSPAEQMFPAPLRCRRRSLSVLLRLRLLRPLLRPYRSSPSSSRPIRFVVKFRFSFVSRVAGGAHPAEQTSVASGIPLTTEVRCFNERICRSLRSEATIWNYDRRSNGSYTQSTTTNSDITSMITISRSTVRCIYIAVWEIIVLTQCYC